MCLIVVLVGNLCIFFQQELRQRLNQITKHH